VIGYVGGVLLRRLMVPSAAFRVVVLTLLSMYAVALLGRVVLAP
jgi:hypothetical protein